METVVKTIEQLEEETRQAQDALAAAKQVARDAEQEEKRKADEANRMDKEKAIDARRLVTLQAIQTALNAKGLIYKIKEGHEEERERFGGGQYRIWIASCFETDSIRVEFSLPQYSYQTAKVAVVFRDANSKNVRFPQKKDGSFSYDKIVAAVLERNNIRKARAERQNTAEENREASLLIAARLKENLGLSPYTSVVFASESCADKVVIKIAAALTEEQAEKLLDFTKSLGIQLS